MSPQVKPKVFTVAHKPPQPPPPPPPICPTTSLLSFPTTALPHQSQALLITPQSASSRLVTVSLQGLSLALILPQMLFPQRSTWLPHLPPSSQLQCHPEIPVAPGEEHWLLDTSLDEVYWPCSHWRAMPSFPSQLEWKIGLAWANTIGILNSPS